LGKGPGGIASPIEGVTPRRRGDSARRVQWPEQGEAGVRNPGIAAGCSIPRSLASHHHVDKRWCRLAPQAAGGALRPFGKTSGLRAADDRRPRGGVSTLGHPRTAPAPRRTKPAAGMVSGRSDRISVKPTGSTRLRVAWGPRQGTDTPECRRSAASGMRRTIAPLPGWPSSSGPAQPADLRAEGEDQNHQREQRHGHGRGLHQVAATIPARGPHKWAGLVTMFLIGSVTMLVP